ncbi:MAG: hypothetical protein WDM89_16905 [Rhizomicrobium sp.]
MRHFASRKFWDLFDQLPADVRALAEKNFALLKENPKHPSLHFKKVEGSNLWSVRIGLQYRAIATEVNGDIRWHWIGKHNDYNHKLS